MSHWLVHRLAPQQGQTILELSAGLGETGFLAAPLLGLRGLLISSDREPGMVEAAARLGSERGVANAEFRRLEAERIQLPDASVDGVLSRFGYILKATRRRHSPRSAVFCAPAAGSPSRSGRPGSATRG